MNKKTLPDQKSKIDDLQVYEKKCPRKSRVFEVFFSQQIANRLIVASFDAKLCVLKTFP